VAEDVLAGDRPVVAGAPARLVVRVLEDDPLALLLVAGVFAVADLARAAFRLVVAMFLSPRPSS
jgi:hypothetical protein